VWLVCAAAAALACSKDREEPANAPTFADDTSAVLTKTCAQCHAGATPAAGYRTTSYLESIACIAPSFTAPATVAQSDGASASAPIVAALSSPSHAGVTSASDVDVLTRWVAAGAPSFRGTVHQPGIVDPRSAAFHGNVLKASRYSQMLDANDPNACGRCHDGAAKPAGVALAAPGATACTTCHASTGGTLACTTCHGAGANSYPPRDACFFAADAARTGNAHRAHVEATATHTSGFACSTCHLVPDAANPIQGSHANGVVEIVFDQQRVAPEASWDGNGACAVSCHDRGGKRPKPSWSDATPMGCNDCHSAPPANHYKGACSTCHHEANATGTSLAGGGLHMNGKVDLGDGSGTCGACHGHGDSAWPTTGAHAAHQSPSLTTPVACETCHVVPKSLHDPGHMNGTVEVVMSGRALDRGAAAAWDGAKCTNVACHGAALPEAPPIVPAWNDATGAAGTCGACHGVPPNNHTTSLECGRSTCHTGEFQTNAQITITSVGKMLHVNGVIDVAQ
jgi:predicted CxxxxCH...CXXCH cytochrome family protein